MGVPTAIYDDLEKDRHSRYGHLSPVYWFEGPPGYKEYRFVGFWTRLGIWLPREAYKNPYRPGNLASRSNEVWAAWCDLVLEHDENWRLPDILRLLAKDKVTMVVDGKEVTGPILTPRTKKGDPPVYRVMMEEAFSETVAQVTDAFVGRWATDWGTLRRTRAHSVVREDCRQPPGHNSAGRKWHKYKEEARRRISVRAFKVCLYWMKHGVKWPAKAPKGATAEQLIQAMVDNVESKRRWIRAPGKVAIYDEYLREGTGWDPFLPEPTK